MSSPPRTAGGPELLLQGTSDGTGTDRSDTQQQAMQHVRSPRLPLEAQKAKAVRVTRFNVRPTQKEREAERSSSLPPMLEQCIRQVDECKGAVGELRGSCKAAVSHREKCCAILSAAMAACLALEQVLYSGQLDAARELRLQRLCSAVMSAIDLGLTRVRVYGGQARWKKYFKVPVRGATAAKFEEVVTQLEALTAKAWELSEGSSVSRYSFRRGTSFREVKRSADSTVETTLVRPSTVLTRCRLRRGCHCHWVKAVLYVPPPKGITGMGQVWWAISGMYRGALFVHDLDTGLTQEVKACRKLGRVLCLASNGQGAIWTGHIRGEVRVWSQAKRSLLCPSARPFKTDVRAMAIGGGGGIAAIGSEDGQVSVLQFLPAKAGEPPSLQVTAALRCDTCTNGNQAASPGAAHAGPVWCLTLQGDTVYTSGGSGPTATVCAWTLAGQLLASAPAGPAGSVRAMAIITSLVEIKQSRRALHGMQAPAAGEEGECQQLLTGHENGQLHIWDLSNSQLRLVLRVGERADAVRAIVTCRRLGLIATAHADGHLQLRLIPRTSWQQRFAVAADGTAGVTTLNPSYAPVQAHRSGLVIAVGGDAGIITAGSFGSIVMFPEAELRSAAEAAGFALPSAFDADGLPSPTAHNNDMSKVLQRYFAPINTQKARAAIARASQSRVLAAEDAEHRASSEEHDPQSGMAHNDSDSSCQSTPATAAAVPRQPPPGGAGAFSGTPSSLQQQQLQMQGSAPRDYDAEVAQIMSMSSQLDPPSPPSSRSTSPSITDHDINGVRSYDTAASLSSSVGPLPMSQHQPGQPERVSSGLSAEASSQVELKSSSSLIATTPSGQLSFRPSSGGSGSSPLAEAAGEWLIDFKDLVFKHRIGEGSIGRVHLGQWQETDVAIKLLNSAGQLGIAGGSAGALREESAQLRTLNREVQIMASIRHPNVVLFMGVCLEPPCLVSEFCARGSLYDVLSRAAAAPPGQLDWGRRLNMALDAAKGVLQLHSHKPIILHRDLKSPNLLVDRHWRVKVGDFNLSRVMGAAAAAASVASSLSANNPRWLAPEVIQDQAFSPASDVFAFGVIMWELLTWRIPWESMGPFQIMVAVTEKRQRPGVPALEQLPGGVFPRLPDYLALMEACWATHPADRPCFEAIIVEIRSLLESVTHRRRTSWQPSASRLQQASGSIASRPPSMPAAPPTPDRSRTHSGEAAPTNTGQPAMSGSQVGSGVDGGAQVQGRSLDSCVSFAARDDPFAALAAAEEAARRAAPQPWVSPFAGYSAVSSWATDAVASNIAPSSRTATIGEPSMSPSVSSFHSAAGWSDPRDPGSSHPSPVQAAAPQ